jgi:hypothetical protein
VASIVAGLIGATISLTGVLLGVWLNGRREHRRWVRDQQLRAAIDFIGATGELYADSRAKAGKLPADERRALWLRLQDGRSALYLLCDQGTVDLAEELVDRVRHSEPAPDGGHDPETVALLRRVVQHLRFELGAEPAKRLPGT